MARYSAAKLGALLIACDNAPTNDAAGAALEDLVAYLFEKIPGIELHERNVLDGKRVHELDLVFWQSTGHSKLHFLDTIIIVECKNTGAPVSSQGVGWLVRKLQVRGARSGVLVALSGITGAADKESNAHQEVYTALVGLGIKILLLSREEIAVLVTSDELVDLLKRKFLSLSVRQTVQ